MIGKQFREYFTRIKHSNDDGMIDRLNHTTTVLILLAFAITIGAKQQIGKPIQCWVPDQFKDGWENYTENYCFIQNTYFTRMSDQLPEHIDRSSEEISYYQWVPIVLALQALMFYLPRMFWSATNAVNITALVNSSLQTTKANSRKLLKDESVLEENCEMITRFMTDSHVYRQGAKERQKNVFTKTMFRCWGVKLTAMFIISKLLYLMNVVFQFLIMNRFLGSKYRWWGIEILMDLAKGVEWEFTGHFPRVTYCDFQVRVLGNVHKYTVQCVLMINMLNEKVYLFLWFWFLFVGICNLLDIFSWISAIFIPSNRKEFIRRYLRNSSIGISYDFETFLDQHVNIDALLELHLIALNAGHTVALKVVENLWYSVPEHKKPSEGKLGIIPKNETHEEREDGKEKIN